MLLTALEPCPRLREGAAQNLVSVLRALFGRRGEGETPRRIERLLVRLSFCFSSFLLLPPPPLMLASKIGLVQLLGMMTTCYWLDAQSPLCWPDTARIHHPTHLFFIGEKPQQVWEGARKNSSCCPYEHTPYRHILGHISYLKARFLSDSVSANALEEHEILRFLS